MVCHVPPLQFCFEFFWERKQKGKATQVCIGSRSKQLPDAVPGMDTTYQGLPPNYHVLEPFGSMGDKGQEHCFFSCILFLSFLIPPCCKDLCQGRCSPVLSQLRAPKHNDSMMTTASWHGCMRLLGTNALT